MENQQDPTYPGDIMRLNTVVGKEIVSRSSDGSTQSKPKFAPTDFPVQKESDIAGLGQPMSLPFLINQIKEYNYENTELYKDLKNQKASLENMLKSIEEGVEPADSQRVNELKSILDVTNRAHKLVGSKEIAIDLGKESLLLILSQKDCEGIRFYFCNSPYGSNSVAAVGIRAFLDESGKPHQSRHPQDPSREITDAQDIGVNDNFQSILDEGAISGKTQILNEEVGPPYRTRQVVDHQLTKEPEDIENRFINSLRSVL